MLLSIIKKTFCLLILLAGSLVDTGHAQDVESGYAISPGAGQLAEYLIESADPEDFEDAAAFEAYIEGMLDLFPVDLNRSSLDELLLVPGLSERLVEAIVAYRADRAFTNVEDLVNVPGIGQGTVNRIRPWVTARHHSSRRKGWSENLGAQQFFRFQQSFPAAAGYQGSGDTPSQYPGSPARLYHRQTITSARLSVNLTQMKLPGETYRSPHGFDFTSAHLGINDAGPVNRLIIGDYAVRFGQGLVVWSSATFGKGAVAHTAPYRRSHGITPYRSSGQIRFFRGAASEISLPLPYALRQTGAEINISTFYSRRSRSAVEISGDTIRPPSTNPYHRTESELSRRINTLESVQGGNISLTHHRLSLGISVISYALNRPVVPHPASSRFQGSDHRAMGTDGAFVVGPVRIFGEYAWRTGSSVDKAQPYMLPHKKKNAWIAGIMGSFSGEMDWVFSARSYQPGYWAEYAGGFGEGVGVPVNQKGWYFGLRLRPVPRVIIQGFLDRFIFPEPKRGYTRPSSGWETMLNLQFRQRTGLNYQIRVRFKERGIELENSDAFLRTRRITGVSGRFTGRFQMNWQIHRRLFIRSQYDVIETTGTNLPEKTGLAISKTIRFQPARSLRLDFGWAIFDTDDFSSRLYLFEYDLTNVMGSRMAYGTGRQSYVVIRFRPHRRMLIEAKYAHTMYSDRPVVGSGHDATQGPVRSHAGIQLRFQY